MQKLPTRCPLCESHDVRSAAVTDSVIVAQCDACAAHFTIQRPKAVLVGTDKTPYALRPTIKPA
jgi:hypothetical protein